jgi:RHS repeat-associated protein
MAQQTVRSRALDSREVGKSRRRWNREAPVRHRDYSPTLGRFIEMDPIGFEAGDNNWYRFVANGPTGKVDPSGLVPNQSETFDPDRALARIRELERQGLSHDQILSTLSDYLLGENQHGRYFYTDKYGWVDLRHFAELADYGNTVSDLGARACGYANELLQWRDGSPSAFSYEDLPSNAAGAAFGSSLDSRKAISAQFAEWLRNVGARRADDPEAERTSLPLNDPSENGKTVPSGSGSENPRHGIDLRPIVPTFGIDGASGVNFVTVTSGACHATPRPTMFLLRPDTGTGSTRRPLR